MVRRIRSDQQAGRGRADGEEEKSMTLEYEIGHRHGLADREMYWHRKGKLYEIEAANEQYRKGYRAGVNQRRNRSRPTYAFRSGMEK
jgi:hypothetical protein